MLFDSKIPTFPSRPKAAGTLPNGCASGSLGLTKKLMRDHQRIAAQIAEEGQLFKERLKTPEAREAFAAFAERRSPDFTKVA
jgi:enoyl-CoA hydratase/carnithine racemase